MKPSLGGKMEVDIWWVRVGEGNWWGQGAGKVHLGRGNAYAKLCISKPDTFIKHSIVHFN